MRLGMVVRADAGGLGQQSHHLWRCLQPDETVVIVKGEEARGAELPDRYGEALHCDQRLNMKANKLLSTCDLTLSIETGYIDGIYDERTFKVALIANPELWNPSEPHERLGVHTDWEVHRFEEKPTVVPYPSPTELFPHRGDSGPGWYHPEAPAMLDRNGTELLLNALRHTRVPSELWIRADRESPWHRRRNAPTVIVGATTVHWLRGRTDDPADAYPQECSMLLLPRRYGGCCLPAVEAACLGWGAAMLDLPPQRSWPHVAPLPVAEHTKPARMRGGMFDVAQADSFAIARALDELNSSPEVLAQYRRKAERWVEETSWFNVEREWRAWLT